MIRLLTLGTVHLQGPPSDQVASLLHQPKRLALLVYLALSRPPGLRLRDCIVATFWPERDACHARAALSQALYVLRQSMGEDVIAGSGRERVGLAPDAVWCDAHAFDLALAAGDPTLALELYRGPLLDGFHVADAPGFERWLDEERGRYQDLATTAALECAVVAEAEGNAPFAAHWARRAYELSGSEECVLRRVLSMLERLGDRSGALRLYGRFLRDLDEELGVTPSAETQALIRQLEADPSGGRPCPRPR